MKHITRLPLFLIIVILCVVPLMAWAQESPYLDELDIPLVPLDTLSLEEGNINLPPAQSPPEDAGYLEYPETNPSLSEDDIPMPSDQPSLGEDDIPMPPAQPETVPPLTEDDIPMPPTLPAPAIPVNIGLARGFYRMVGAPSVEQEGVCFNPAIGEQGICGGLSYENHTGFNCFSSDSEAISDPRQRLIPVCQAQDQHVLTIYEQGFSYPHMVSNAYGQGSVNRTMLVQDGVSTGTYTTLSGTQIEVLSRTQFVVKQVYRERGGCSQIITTYYELVEETETACEQVIEVVPEDLPQEPISTPPPLPPIETESYTVAMPIIPETCTADTRPPDAFTQAALTVDEGYGALTVDYGAGTFTAFQNGDLKYSYADTRQGVFMLDFTFYGEQIGFHWYKANAGGECMIDGELRPTLPENTDAPAPDTNTPMAVIVGRPYTVTWTPMEAFCTPETLAALPNFTQATLTAQDNGFVLNFDGGSYALVDESGANFYSYMQMGTDGSYTMISLNSFAAEQFSLLYQMSTASGQSCMATVELRP